MKNYIKLLLLFCYFLANSQNIFSKDNITSTQINLSNTEYKDFVLLQNRIYALTKNNDFVSIDFKNDKIKTVKNNISSIAKKSNGEIIFGSKDGKIFLLNKKEEIKQIDKVDAEILSILITSKDKYVVYTKKSVYFNKENYVPKKETNFYGKGTAKHKGVELIEPDYIYLDKLNFVWFTFDEGEFGGNVCFFDTNKKEFIYEHWLSLDDTITSFPPTSKYKDKDEYFKKLKEAHSDKIRITTKDTIYQYPYQLSISSDTKGVAYDKQNNLFISSSGSGIKFGYENEKGFSYFVDGSIVKIKEKKKDIYNYCFDENILEDEKYKNAFESNFYGYKNKDNQLRENILTKNEINVLGSITYNKYDKNLYFYSTKGFYLLKDVNCKFTKELVLSPSFTCEYGCKKENCTHLNVIKFEFISEKEILFLTKNNGIGYYDGNKIKYLK